MNPPLPPWNARLKIPMANTPHTHTVFSLAVDGPKCGTQTRVFVTEREACAELVSLLGYSEDDAANALLAEEDFDALEDLLQDSTDGLTTWSFDEHVLTFP